VKDSSIQGDFFPKTAVFGSLGLRSATLEGKSFSDYDFVESLFSRLRRREMEVRIALFHRKKGERRQSALTDPSGVSIPGDQVIPCR
jgi:hypothetical protein